MARDTGQVVKIAFLDKNKNYIKQKKYKIIIYSKQNYRVYFFLVIDI